MNAAEGQMKGYIHSKTSMRCRINNVNKLMRKQRRGEKGGEGGKQWFVYCFKWKQEAIGLETVDSNFAEQKMYLISPFQVTPSQITI